MPMRILLLVLLLAPAASAQPVADRPTTDQRIGLVVVGVAGGSGAFWLASRTLGEDAASAGDVVFLVASYAGGVAGGTALLGRALGLRVSEKALLVDTVAGIGLGAVAGVAAGGAAGLVAHAVTRGDEYYRNSLFPLAVAFVVAVPTAAVTSGIIATRRFRASPVALPGASGAGLRLVVDL